MDEVKMNSKSKFIVRIALILLIISSVIFGQINILEIWK